MILDNSGGHILNSVAKMQAGNLFLPHRTSALVSKTVSYCTAFQSTKSALQSFPVLEPLLAD